MQYSERNSSELEVVKQLFGELSDKDKRLFIKSLKANITNETNKSTPLHKNISCCPHCKSERFVKNGKKDGIQRFMCKDCKKTFTYTNNTILFATKKDLATWRKFIHCMIEKYSLRKTAQICKINLSTAFVWRHKILDTLQNMMNEVKLDGIVEADETFLPLSFKGHHKNFSLPRPAKQRGTKAKKRGLSKEQVCISCGVNLNGLSISKVSNLGKPKLQDLEKVFDGKISKDSVLVTDSFRAYLKLANDMDLSHIKIPRNKHKIGAFNIQTINSYHSRLKLW